MIKSELMEEDLDYKTVTFRVNGGLYEKPNNSETIYEEVKTKEQPCYTNSALSAKETEARPYTLLHLVAAALGIICVILASVAVALGVRLDTVASEREKENVSLEKQKRELVRERDGLNWTIGVIREYKDFPVQSYCPQEGACKPCLDDWVQFQSNCYLFSKNVSSWKWKTWQESRDKCRSEQADLLVIDSKEEQEFISSHTKWYHDDKHGYWTGLVKNKSDPWTWLEKWNLTVSYWRGEVSSKDSCGLTLGGGDPLANWQNTGCEMKNRWICERRALIRLD